MALIQSAIVVPTCFRLIGDGAEGSPITQTQSDTNQSHARPKRQTFTRRAVGVEVVRAYPALLA